MDKKEFNKYDILLAFVNSLLKNINKEPIDDLKKFVEIDRNALISEDAMKSFEEHKEHILKCFGKYDSGYYRKDKAKNFVISFIRRALKDFDLQLVIKLKRTRVNNYATLVNYCTITDK